jgi:YHS domain-containing protein
MGKLSLNADKNNVVLEGYDVVSYFTDYEATKGSKKYASEYQGYTFQFASKANKELFENNPSKYLPAYGGYCAFAVGAKEAKVPVNPKTFKIVNGELLLFFNGDFQGKPLNTIVLWNEDEAKFKDLADAKWPAVK